MSNFQNSQNCRVSGTSFFEGGFCKNVRFSWLWLSECQHVLLGPVSLGIFVSLGVTLDSAETPFAKTPFSWLLRVAQEPTWNRKPKTSEPFFPKPCAEPEPPEPFFRNRNRNRNHPFLLICTETQKSPFLQRNCRNRKPEQLELFQPQTVTEPGASPNLPF